MTQFKTKYGHSVALILLFCLAINVTNGFLDDQTFRRQKSEENKRISQSLSQTKHESEIITNQDKEGETQLHRSSSMARDGVPMIQNRRESYNQVTNRQSRICQSPACTEKRESINLSIRSQDSVDRKTVNNRREHRNNLNLLIKSQRLSNEQGTIEYNQDRRDLIEKSVRGGEINNNRFRHDSRLRNERDRDYFTEREQERTIDSRNNNNLIRDNRKYNQRERVLSNESRLNRFKGNTREVQSRKSRENIRDVSPQRIRESDFRDQNTEQERRKFIIDSRNFRVNEQVQNRNVENRDVTRKCINNCDKREHFDRNVRLQSQISSSALTGILRNTLGENRGSERHFSITDTRREVRDNLDRRNVRDNTQRNTNMQTLRDSRNNVERENTILTDTRRQIRVDTDRNLERTIRNNVVDISRQNEITRKQSRREDILDRRSERRVHDNREREITDNINNAERISRKNIDGSILTDTRREIRVNVYRNLERIVPSSIGLDISQQNEITRTQSRRENILDRRSERRVRDKRERENHIRSTTANTRREVRDDLNRRNIRDNTDNTILADTRRETRIDADRNLKQTIRSNVGRDSSRRNISEQKERDNIDRSTTSNTRRDVTDDMNLRPVRDITERNHDFSTTRVSRENTETRREIRVDEDRNLERSVRINAERDTTRQNKITSRHILDSRSEREIRDNREREYDDRFTIINTRREIRDDLDRRNVRDNRERNNDFSNNIQNRRNLNIARVSRENTDTRREIRVDEDRNLERSVRNNGERSTSRQNEIASRHLLGSRLEREIRDNRHRENSDRFTIINTRREVRDDLDRKNVRDNLERNKDFSHDIQNSRNLNVRKNTETRREIRVDEDRNLERNVRNNAERDAIRQNEITSRHISDSRLEREIHDNRARENSDRSTITNTRREVRDDLDHRNVRDNRERNKDFSNDIQNRRNLNIVRVSRENTDTRREIRVEEDRNLERSVRNNAERDNTRQNQITSRQILDSRSEREIRDNRERENGDRFTIINNRREVRDDLDHRNVRDNTERSNAFSNNIQTDRNNPVAVRVSRDTRREIRVAEDRHLEHILRNAEQDAIRDNRNNLDRRSEHKFRDNRVRIIRETTDHSITSNVRREIRDDLNRRNIRNSEERDTSRENRKALYRNIRDTLTETRRENVDRFISTRGQIKNNLERNDRTENQRELTNTVDNRLKHNVRDNTERIRENIDRHRETRFDLNRERTERDDSRRNGRSLNTEIRREIRNLVRSVHDNSERENIDRVTLVENRNNRRIETRRENINNLDRRLENYDRGSTERTGRDNDRLVLTNSIRVGQNVEHGKIKNKFRDVPLESRRELTNNRDINISGNRYKQADNRDLTLSIRRESRILDGNSRNIFERDLTIRTRDRESRGTDVKMNRNWIPDEIREDSRNNLENYVRKVNFKSDSRFNEIERTLVSHREVPDFNRGQVKISTDDHVKRQLRNGGNKIVMDNGQQIPNKIKMSSKELDYLPNLNSTMLWNTVKIILASILFAQVLSSSSKTKKFRLQDSFYFVTLHKEKVN